MSIHDPVPQIPVLHRSFESSIETAGWEVRRADWPCGGKLQRLLRRVIWGPCGEDLVRKLGMWVTIAVVSSMAQGFKSLYAQTLSSLEHPPAF